MKKFISSQRHLDPDIVEEKKNNRDFNVNYITFEYEGEIINVIVDGHHSLAAAKEMGEKPVFMESEPAKKEYANYINGTEKDKTDLMNILYVDSDWYDIATGGCVW